MDVKSEIDEHLVVHSAFVTQGMLAHSITTYFDPQGSEEGHSGGVLLQALGRSSHPQMANEKAGPHMRELPHALGQHRIHRKRERFYSSSTKVEEKADIRPLGPPGIIKPSKALPWHSLGRPCPPSIGQQGSPSGKQ